MWGFSRCFVRNGACNLTEVTVVRYNIHNNECVKYSETDF